MWTTDTTGVGFDTSPSEIARIHGIQPTDSYGGCDILHHQDGVSTCCSSRQKWVEKTIYHQLSSSIINYHHLFNHPQYMIYTMVPLRYPPGSQLDHSRKRCAGVSCPVSRLGDGAWQVESGWRSDTDSIGINNFCPLKLNIALGRGLVYHLSSFNIIYMLLKFVKGVNNPLY